MEEEKKEKNIRRKNLILLIILLILIIIFGIAIYNSPRAKGYRIYGTEKCFGHQDLDMITYFGPVSSCTICGKEGLNYYGICSNCAEKTNRCQYCGKLLSENF